MLTHWGEKLYLIFMIDDATSQWRARFVRHDSSEENLRQLRRYCPAAWASGGGLYRQGQLVSGHAAGHPSPGCPEEQLSQIGRALKELNIEWIAAHSPQAKGRVEGLTEKSLPLSKLFRNVPFLFAFT